MQVGPDWLAPGSRKLVPVSDGESIAVWDQGGTGIPMIFVHGFPQNHRSWKHVLSHLSSSQQLENQQMRFIVYDLRGHGDSSKQGEASWQRLLQDHLDLVAALKLDRYHLVGHDWGGAIGLHVSRYQPESLLSLVVLNTNYWETDIGGMWHMVLLNVPLVAPLCFRWAPDRMYNAFITRSLMAQTQLDASTQDSYLMAFRNRETVTYWIRLYRNMAKGLVRQALPGFLKSILKTSAVRLPHTSDKAFQTKTLLIWGALDTFNPLHIGQAMGEMLKNYGTSVRFEPVADSKHFVPEDQPDTVANLIADHLEVIGSNTQ